MPDTNEVQPVAPATHEDAVDLIECECDATVIAAHGYSERQRVFRRDARARRVQTRENPLTGALAVNDPTGLGAT